MADLSINRTRYGPTLAAAKTLHVVADLDGDQGSGTAAHSVSKKIATLAWISR